MITISSPVIATRIMERLKNVKKRWLSSATGSSECPLIGKRLNDLDYY